MKNGDSIGRQIETVNQRFQSVLNRTQSLLAPQRKTLPGTLNAIGMILDELKGIEENLQREHLFLYVTWGGSIRGNTMRR